MTLIDTIIRRQEQRLLGALERYVDLAHGIRCVNRSATWIAAALVGVLSIGGILVPASARAADGAYTEAQARSGERAYAEHCAGCHGAL